VSECIGICAGGTVLISRRARPPLQVLVTPIRASTLRLSGKIAVAVFIHDPSRPQGPADTLLRSLHGLTRAECRVALLSSDGRGPREIAGKIGVTENTVRSQIKSIYNKTGVKRHHFSGPAPARHQWHRYFDSDSGGVPPGFPQARIIMLTSSDTDGEIQRALRAGASGNVLKSLPQDELLVVIRSVHGANDMYRLMWQLVSPNI
jgi:DNA-binding NarL/FixJ family response regulator